MFIPLDRTAYNYGISEYNNSEGQGNAMADAIDKFIELWHNEHHSDGDEMAQAIDDLCWAKEYWRTKGGTEEA